MSGSSVNLNNVQGDIIIGLQKKVESFLFCTLNQGKINEFRKTLKSKIIPIITTTQQVLDTQKRINENKNKNELLPITQFNLGFSFSGLKKLGLAGDEIPTEGNTNFTTGQRVDAINNLGDPKDAKTNKLNTWSNDFLVEEENNSIDMILLFTAPDNKQLSEKVEGIKKIIEEYITHSFVRSGNVRPGDQAGHEHFGFLDSISRPAIRNVNATPELEKPGIVDPDVILLGYAQNNNPKLNWAKDGTFMAFRELKQLVPEFHLFCDQSAQQFKEKKNHDPNLTGDLIGARIIGRWKSGAPIVLAPEKDNPELNRSEDFDFSNDLNQLRCPYAAHIRKANPRKGLIDADPNTAVLPHLMIRSGIPYGPELSEEERKSNQTKHNRGLLFISYQSKLESGFQFVQQKWCNNVDFPSKTKVKITPGYDLLIGQTGDDGPRTAQNINPLGVEGTTDPNNVLTAPHQFVIPLGGEYFFMPSIQAINERLGL